MARKMAKVTADVVETTPVTLAGVDTHPGWHVLRTLAQRITTPLLPDDYLHLANPLWSARELRGRILAVRRETQDSATLVIKPGWGFGFDYKPGQYMGIGLLVDGRWRWRSYSLTSSPRRGARTVTITVKAMPEGFLSAHLVAGVQARHDRATGYAAGQFRAARSAAADHVVRHRRVRDHPGDVDAAHAGRAAIRSPTSIHLHSAPTEDDVMFGAELEAAGRRPRRVSAATARHPHPGPVGLQPARRRGARLANATDLGLRPRADAQGRRPRVGGRRRQGPLAPRTFRGVARRAGRRRRHGDLRQEREKHRGRRGDVADGSR